MSSSLELLESRIAPAGIITLESDGFTFFLTGDEAGNELEITQSGFELTLTPQNGTQILNKLTPNSSPVSDPVTISLLNNDLANKLGANLNIELGGGADILNLDSLTIPDSLRVDMGSADVAEGSDERLSISNLSVGYNLDLSSESGQISILGSLYVGLRADIFSDVESFIVGVDDFFVGGDLEIDAILDNDNDTFRIFADALFVYDGFDLYANIYAANPLRDAVAIETGSFFTVGGAFRVQNDGTGGESAVLIATDVFDIAGPLLVENFSTDPEDTLGLLINADVLRLNGGLLFTSASPAPSTVEIGAGLAIIDGPVTAKLSKGSGELSIVASNLTIQGNVSFASKGTGNLHLEGAGDVFGKVSASLGNGAGTVGIFGSSGGELAISGLNITTPKKLPASVSGAEIRVEDVVVFGKANLKLGRGNDIIGIHDTVITARTVISTGDGSDTVNLHTDGNSSSEFRGGLGVSLGSGDDFLRLGRLETFSEATALFLYGAKKFDGGSGTDLYSAENRNVQFLKSITKKVALNPVVRAFEPGRIIM